MKLNINKDYGQSVKHFLLEGEEDETSPYIMLRPYPKHLESQRFGADGGLIFNGATERKKFMYCVTGWGNILDEESGEPIELTDKVKETVYKWNLEGIATFVWSQLLVGLKDEEKQEKN